MVAVDGCTVAGRAKANVASETVIIAITAKAEHFFHLLSDFMYPTRFFMTALYNIIKYL